MAKLRNTSNQKVVIVVPILLVILLAGFLTYSFANFKSIKTLDIIGSYFIGNSYTLSYDNPSCTSKTIKNGKNYGELCAPTYTGYTFNGWTGKNLYNKDATPYMANSWIGQDGTITSESHYDLYKIDVLPNTTYTITNGGKLSNPGYAIFNANGSYLTGDRYQRRIEVTFTTPATASYMLFSVVTDDVDFANYYDQDIFQIEIGSSATSYEPYHITSSTKVRTNQNITLIADKTANQYNMRLNYNNEMIPTLTNTTSVVHACHYKYYNYCNNYIDYTITDGVITVTNTGQRDDGYGIIEPIYFNLETGKSYIFNIDSDAEFASGTNDTVQAMLFLNGTSHTTENPNQYVIDISSEHHNVVFTPEYSATYYLRLDVNKSGATHKFWNIHLSEISSPSTVNYGDPYGNLQTLSKTNYIFEGWNGKNKFDINNDWVERQGGVTKENNIIVFDSSSRANNTIGQLRIQRYYNSTNMTDSDNLCSQSISSIKANRTYSCRFTKTSDFDKIAIRGNTQYYDPLMAITTELTNGVTYVLSYDVEEVSSDETVIKLKNIQIEEDTVRTTYEPYIISSTTPITQAKDHILTAKWNQLYDNYLSSKPGFTVEECTANYNNNRINVTLNASNTANLGARVIFNKKNTQGGVLHLKGTMTVNANSGAEKAKIGIHLGSTSRGNDLGSYDPVREISRGTTVTFDEKVTVPNNAYITIAIGRDNTNYQGSLYGSVTFTDFYIAKN